MTNFEGIHYEWTLEKRYVIEQLQVRHDNVVLLEYYFGLSSRLEKNIRETLLIIRNKRNTLYELEVFHEQIHIHRQKTYQILTELLKKTHSQLSPFEKKNFWDDVKMRRRNNLFFLQKIKKIRQEIQELKTDLKGHTTELSQMNNNLKIANFNLEHQRSRLSQRLYRDGEYHDYNEDEFLDEDWEE